MKDFMLARFLFWFKNLFRRDENEFEPDYSDVKKMKPSRYNTDEYITMKEKRTQNTTRAPSSSSSNKKTSFNNSNSIPSRDALLKQIKSNIFFLEQLQELLMEKEQYLSYQKKILSMLKNSHNSHKIISRLRDDAPYYENTMEMIFRHTKSISTILEIST